jgi:hypothetical protein
MWKGVVVVSLGLIGSQLGPALTSDSSPERHAVHVGALGDRMRAVVAEVRRGAGVGQVSSPEEPGGQVIVSAGHRTSALPVIIVDDWYLPHRLAWLPDDGESPLPPGVVQVLPR